MYNMLLVPFYTLSTGRLQWNKFSSLLVNFWVTYNRPSMIKTRYPTRLWQNNSYFCYAKYECHRDQENNFSEIVNFNIDLRSHAGVAWLTHVSVSAATVISFLSLSRCYCLSRNNTVSISSNKFNAMFLCSSVIPTVTDMTPSLYSC